MVFRVKHSLLKTHNRSLNQSPTTAALKASPGTAKRLLSVQGLSRQGKAECWLWQGATHQARKPVTTEVITCTKLNHNLMQRIWAGTMMQDAVLSVQQYEHNCSITGDFIHLPLPFILQMEIISSNFNPLNYLGKQF